MTEEVQRAVGKVAEALGLGGSRVCLLLPDGLARILLLELPPGVEPQDYARFRLTPSLPYPASEAVVDGVSMGKRRFLSAAVRRVVVKEYEDIAGSLGLAQERLDLSPLAAAQALVKESVAPGTVDVILGDTALCLAVHGAGALRAFRTRRRDPGPEEAHRLRDDALRTVATTGDGGEPRMRVVGSGAGEIVRGLVALGSAARHGWSVSGGVVVPAGGEEYAWLGGALS